MARGSMQKLATGWRLRVELPKDPVTGQRRWHSEMFKGTKRAAEARLVELQAKVDGGDLKRGGQIPLASYLTDLWLPYYKSTVRYSSYRGTHSICVHHIIPALGDTPLSQITARDAQLMYARMTGQLKPATVARVHAILCAALNQAVTWEIIPKNPVSRAAPRKPRREYTLWSAADLNTFLDQTEDRLLRMFVALVSMTGLRRSEALALRWCDVSLDDSTLHVQYTITDCEDDVFSVGPPKTESSRRVIVIPQRARDELADYRQWQQDTYGALLGEIEWVFEGGKRRPLHPRAMFDRFIKQTAKLGLPRIRIHDLRHGVATHMMRSGVPLKVISEHLGHSSISITANTYQHVDMEMRRKAAEVMDQYLGET